MRNVRYNQVAVRRLNERGFEILELKDGDVIVGALHKLLPEQEDSTSRDCGLPMAGRARTRNSSISSNLSPLFLEICTANTSGGPTRCQFVPMSLDVDLIADPSLAVTEVVHGHDRRLALTDPATS